MPRSSELHSVANGEVGEWFGLNLGRSITARYLRVEKVKTMLRGKFAIRDLRLFSHDHGQIPVRVEHTGEKSGDDAKRGAF